MENLCTFTTAYTFRLCEYNFFDTIGIIESCIRGVHSVRIKC